MNITQGLRRALQMKPGAVAVLDSSQSMTWAELGSRVARFASALQKLGLKDGDTVAVLAANSPRYLEMYLNISWAGGVIVPLNYRWSLEENLFAIGDCGAKILIVDDTFAEAGRTIADAIAGLVLVHTGVGAREGEYRYEELIAHAAPVPDAMRKSGDLAGVFYTGGTTGRSKGVMLSQGNLTSSALHALAEGMFPADAIYLHAAPMFHLANGAAMFAVLLNAGTNAILPTFTPRNLAEAIQTHRVTHTLLVPTMIQMFVDDPSIGDVDLSSLKVIAYGASPISEAVLDRAVARLPTTEFIQLYGMTELSPIATLLPSKDHIGDGRARGRHRSAGRPIVGVEVRIVDPNGNERSRQELGEIIVRGDTVMMGYLNLPEQTQKSIIDGWMHTNDVGRMDEDGYVYVVDRLKDMIITGGENVYSTEVENTLAKHPAVLQCAVFGIPSPQWGEMVHAAVVVRPDADISALTLMEFCKGKIAGYKCPRSVDIRFEPLPTTGAGKIQKQDLRKEFWQGTDRDVA